MELEAATRDLALYLHGMGKLWATITRTGDAHGSLLVHAGPGWLARPSVGLVPLPNSEASPLVNGLDLPVFGECNTVRLCHLGVKLGSVLTLTGFGENRHMPLLT